LCRTKGQKKATRPIGRFIFAGANESNGSPIRDAAIAQGLIVIGLRNAHGRRRHDLRGNRFGRAKLR
jgi:hypothetical protein